MGTGGYGIAELSVFYAAGLQSHREYEILLLFTRPTGFQDAGEGHSRKLASAQLENSTKVVQVDIIGLQTQSVASNGHLG